MKRILLLSPHPDDESIGAGGTLCRHAADGDQILVVFLTSGEGGGHGPAPTEIACIRESEAKRATTHLGVHHIEFWRAPDGALRATNQLVDRLSKTILSFQPDIIYIPHHNEDHPDHRATVRMLKKALLNSNSIGKLPQVLMYEIWTPLQKLDVINNITEFIEKKAEAIRFHKSQCRVMAFDEAILGLNRYRGEMHCWPEGDFAEVFAFLSI